MIDYLNVIDGYTNKELLSVFDKYAIVKLDDENYLICIANKGILNTYKILSSVSNNVNMPIKRIDKENKSFLLFKYNNPSGDNIARVRGLFENIKTLHGKTIYDITIDEKALIKFDRIYKILDYRFTSIENSIRYLENTNIKGDYNWAYLSKYHIYLNAKGRLLKLQESMIKEIKKGLSLKYCLCHGYPSIVYFNKGQIDGFFESNIAIPSSDLARFYVLNDDLYDIITPLINSYLAELKNGFYKLYYQFFVLYLYILSIDQALSLNYESLYNYLQTSIKIEIFLKHNK